MANPYDYKPLHDLVPRVLSNEGTIIIRRGRNNKHVNNVETIADKEELILVSKKTALSEGYCQSKGTPINSKFIDEYEFKIKSKNQSNIMKYKIDLTNCYCIDFDGLSGIKSYVSLPIIEKETSTFRMRLENVSITMDEDICRNQILSVNPKSIINIDKDLIILAKKALLTIENICCYDLRVIHNDHNYYHSSGLKFNIKDRYAVCGGRDIEHLDSKIYGRAIFNGSVFLELEEENILPFIIGCDDLVGGYEGITKINHQKESEVAMKNKILDISRFNNIESPIWDFDFLMEYLPSCDGYREAIKNYPPTNNSLEIELNK